MSPPSELHADFEVRVPAEWETHDACWLAWPSNPDEWPGTLENMRETTIELCLAIGRSERVELLVPDAATELHVTRALGAVDHRCHRVATGDIWTRDTGPTFVHTTQGLAAVCFAFNGWGGKYVMAGDAEVGEAIATRARARLVRSPWVTEGGAIEVNGRGTAMLTRDSILNPNRNPSATEVEVERGLAEVLGIHRVIWLDRGLANDHTDGHIDTLARFVAHDTVVCMTPPASGPNRDALRAVRDALVRADLTVVEVPCPELLDASGDVLPASYVNFYISNGAVIVPTYGIASDTQAVDTIASLFPGRDTIAIDAQTVVRGGGAFHCITQQQPRLS